MADEIVRQLWARIQARDWAGLRSLLHPRVVLEWPATGERFHGAEAVVAVNSEYPEGWSIHVVRVLPGPDGTTAVSEVEVPHDGVGVFAATSWWQVERGLVTHGREFWVPCAGEAPPEWRSRLASRWSGRPAAG